MTWNHRSVITDPRGSNHLGRVYFSFYVCLYFSRVKIPLIAKRLQANSHHENNKKAGIAKVYCKHICIHLDPVVFRKHRPNLFSIRGSRGN